MATLAQVIKANASIKAMKQNYPAIAAALNAPTTVANPVTSAPQVEKPISRETILALIPPAEAWAIYSTAGTLKDDLFAAIDAGNRVWLTYLLGVAQASGKLSATTLGKLDTELKAKVADPTWSATIAGPSIASAAGLGVVTAEMIQAADVAAGNW